MKDSQDPQKPWYKNGLRFKCTGCGKCCTGSPGYVWVTEEEISKIAAYLNLSLEIFVKKYIRRVGDRFSLKEEMKTFNCVFLQGKQCTIYPVRPQQCQTFPWWPENLTSLQEWEELRSYCEGVNHEQADLIPSRDIQQALKKEG